MWGIQEKLPMIKLLKLMSVAKVGLKRAPAESLTHCNGGILAQNKGTLNEVYPAKIRNGYDLGVVIPA